MALSETLLGGQPTAIGSPPNAPQVAGQNWGSQSSISQQHAGDSAGWHVDVDVDARTRANQSPSDGMTTASVREPQQYAQGGRCTDVVTVFAMGAAVALCALLGTLFGDSSDSGLAGAAVALVVGVVCGTVIGLCYRWHGSSSPV